MLWRCCRPRLRPPITVRFFESPKPIAPAPKARKKQRAYCVPRIRCSRISLFVESGTPELIRNTDIQPEVKRLAAAVDFRWLAAACERLAEVESGMRRNLLCSLSLDAFCCGPRAARANRQGLPASNPVPIVLHRLLW